MIKSLMQGIEMGATIGREVIIANNNDVTVQLTR